MAKKARGIPHFAESVRNYGSGVGRNPRRRPESAALQGIGLGIGKPATACLLARALVFCGGGLG